MVFSSVTFLVYFFPISLILYYLMPTRALKNGMLLLLSLVFYAWGEPVYVVLILFSSLNDYVFARLIDQAKEKGDSRRARLFLVESILVNIGLLSFFKYYGFVVGNVNALFGLELAVHDLPLPIGISFYTFQTMSYTIDVYRGQTRAQKNFLALAAYVSLFPQLIAGPIVRYVTIEHALLHRRERFSDVAFGLRRFVIGLGKKVIIANQMGLIADTVVGLSVQGHRVTWVLWLGILAYTFQIYFDFSGYSDMAIGIGRMFGFRFLENFNYPYVAQSITDFWRRWHISLSTWFKEYVYIPLGGNRRRQVRNILVVWLLTGLWHGASWNYVLWGGYYGALLLVEKLLLGRVLVRLPAFFRHFYVMFLVMMGWVFFRIEDFGHLSLYLRGMFTYESEGLATLLLTYQEILYALPFFVLAIVGSTPLLKKLGNWFEQVRLGLLKDAYILAVLMVSIVFLFGSTFNPFIYFRF